MMLRVSVLPRVFALAHRVSCHAAQPPNLVLSPRLGVNPQPFHGLTPSAQPQQCLARKFACNQIEGRATRPPPSIRSETVEWKPPDSPSTNARLVMVYTCGNCEARAVKSFTKAAYEKGVVLVQCPKCEKRHVIADNLGWFGTERNVEEILRQKGEVVTRITDADLPVPGVAGN